MVRWSYNRNNIPDDNYCGEWFFNSNTKTLTAILSGFGSQSGIPSSYPIYISLPYTKRNLGEANPITFSGYSAVGEALPYPEYEETTTGTYVIDVSASQKWFTTSYADNDKVKLNRVFTGTMNYASGPSTAITGETSVQNLLSGWQTKNYCMEYKDYSAVGLNSYYNYNFSSPTTSYSGVNHY